MEIRYQCQWYLAVIDQTCHVEWQHKRCIRLHYTKQLKSQTLVYPWTRCCTTINGSIHLRYYSRQKLDDGEKESKLVSEVVKENSTESSIFSSLSHAFLSSTCMPIWFNYGLWATLKWMTERSYPRYWSVVALLLCCSCTV